MRFPDQALEYGIDQLATCFDGVTDADIVKAVHLCCGYPSYLVSILVCSNTTEVFHRCQGLRNGGWV